MEVGRHSHDCGNHFDARRLISYGFFQFIFYDNSIMMFWICAAVFAAIVTMLVLWAVSRSVPTERALDPDDSMTADITIYKNQMDEIDADLRRGLIDGESAEEARLELSRNILAAEKKVPEKGFSRHRSTAMRAILTLGVLFIPLVTFGVYSLAGHPGVKSHPFNELMRADPSVLTAPENLVRTEALFARNPDDGKLADELAAAYLVAGRFQDSVNTYLDALRLNGETAPRLVGYGMALAGYEGGTITQDAQKAFQKASELSPDDFYPRLFIAEALRQAGKAGEAADGLQAFLERSPKQSPWRSRVEAMIQQLRALPSQSARQSQEEQPSAQPKDQQQTDQEQQDMIAGMVEGLASKLAQQPDDLEGWKMLVHSWLVLKNQDKAKAALAQGQSKLAPEKAAELVNYAKEQGLVSTSISGENRP